MEINAIEISEIYNSFFKNQVQFAQKSEKKTVNYSQIVGNMEKISCKRRSNALYLSYEND